MGKFHEFDFKGLDLAAPWIAYYHMIAAFFEEDGDVRVLLDNEKRNVRVYVSTFDKYTALRKMLKSEITSEDDPDMVYCTVTVYAPNEFTKSINDDKPINDTRAAFFGNPIVSRVLQKKQPFGFTYVLFVPAVVRYWNDSLAEWDGYATTTYQDIAKKIFKPIDGLFWTTDDPE